MTEETMTEQDSEQAYNKMFDALMAVPKDDIVYCNMPLEIAAAEAKQLGIVAEEDRQMLVDAGINPEFVDTLQDRAGAFIYASAKYNTVVNTEPEARRQWEELSPKGYEVQRYLVRFFTFAFRKDDDLLKSVDKIKEGRGDKDMIMDLLSSHIFAKENQDALAKMNMFDQSKNRRSQNTSQQT
ncbi:MAG: hypothetical protein JXR91_08655 [Deltaproteobacteria bacterium]|nr:hypothetical protein [Deltaproteobacteria bacterium]